MQTLQYPIGKFELPLDIGRQQIEAWIKEIDAFPSALKSLVAGITEQQLDSTYRPEGWTIRQVVNHCADSHMNGLCRFKLALTEQNPTIKPYDEQAWATLPDSMEFPVEAALKMLESIHARWVYLLNSLDENQLNSSFIHPEGNKTYTLKQIIALYAWHGKHHLAHVKLALGK